MNLGLLTATAKQELGSTGTNSPRLWNLSELVKVRIIDKLKFVNMEMYMRKGRAHALRELVGCTGLEKQVASNDASPRGAFWHQHCSPVLFEDVWWAEPVLPQLEMEKAFVR